MSEDLAKSDEFVRRCARKNKAFHIRGEFQNPADFSLSEFETRSLPSLTRCYPCSFTFYVVHPIAPFSL